MPRAEHQEADPEVLRREKKLTQEVKRIQAEYPDAVVEVWRGDRIAPPPVRMSIAWGYNQ